MTSTAPAPTVKIKAVHRFRNWVGWLLMSLGQAVATRIYSERIDELIERGRDAERKEEAERARREAEAAAGRGKARSGGGGGKGGGKTTYAPEVTITSRVGAVRAFAQTKIELGFADSDDYTARDLSDNILNYVAELDELPTEYRLDNDSTFWNQKIYDLNSMTKELKGEGL